MALLEKHLCIKKSTLPGAGKGLFTKFFIPKGTRIVEYKGEVRTWREVEQMPDDCYGYSFYFNSRYVIDAWKTKKGVAHFANDARGITRVPGIKNNSEYETENKRCFIKATEDIPAGSEIFVSYGGDYWKIIRYNIRLDEKNNAKEGKKNRKIELPHHLAAKRLAKK